jgi:hypothetical protein
MPKAMKNPLISVKIEKVYDLRGWIEYTSKIATKDLKEGGCYLDMLDVKTLKI